MIEGLGMDNIIPNPSFYRWTFVAILSFYHAIPHGVLRQWVLFGLDADIDQRCASRALGATAHWGSDSHDATWLHIDLVAIQCEDALTTEDNVELLVLLMVVEERNGLTRCQRAERYLHAGGADDLFQEGFALESRKVAYCGHVVAFAWLL